MKFLPRRESHKKRVVGESAMRAKPWDSTKTFHADQAAIAKAVSAPVKGK